MEEKTFGSALRQARVAAGMTQAELGEPKFSRSYVSLLESGARQPTDEVIDTFAQRLHLDRSVVAGWATAEQDEAELALAALQVESVFRLAGHSAPDARDVVARLTSGAIDANSPLGAMVVSMRTLFSESQSTGDSLEALEELMGQRAVQNSPRLYGEIVERRCYRLRLEGRLAESVDVAKAGIGWLKNLPHGRDCLAQPYIALASALAELGREQEAIELIGPLASSLATTERGVVEGNGRWALGNLHFMQGNAAEGIRQHTLASELIDPNRYLRTWARLQRAGAYMRLQYELDLESVPELLDRADRAFSISADATDVLELDAVRARYLFSQQSYAEAGRVALSVLQRADEMAPQERAATEQLAGEALMHTGRSEDGMIHLREAVRVYQSIRAYERALTLCARWNFAPTAA